MTELLPLSSGYERAYERGLNGLIGDRYAAGLESIVVVGDLLHDIDEFHHVVKERDGYPVLTLDRSVSKPGGAGAVASMVRELGEPYILACDPERVGTKRRLIVDGRVLARVDEDRIGMPPKDLPPARLVLIADYAKGTITPETIERIERQYPGREIITDVHQSRPPGYYGRAITKSSWGPAFIRTHGAEGIECGGRRYKVACEAIDQCGAGDAVLAALGVGRVRGMDWPEACQFAAEFAAKVCQRWGAAP